VTNLPEAVCIGPMKSGTSWIHDYLGTRTDVVLPRGVKETHFFDKRYTLGFDWYKKHFPGQNAEVSGMVIEVSPSYFHCTDAPSRMLEKIGNVQLLVVLRDPVQRAWSHYLHLCRKGYTESSLAQAIAEHEEIIEASRYTVHLARWQSVFGNESVRLLFLEDLAEDPDYFTRTLCRTLGIPYRQPPDGAFVKSNEAAVAPSPVLARLGQKAANAMRARRMYFVINFAKRLGLKAVFFGRPRAAGAPALEGDDRKLLECLLASEREYFQQLAALHRSSPS